MDPNKKNAFIPLPNKRRPKGLPEQSPRLRTLLPSLALLSSDPDDIILAELESAVAEERRPASGAKNGESKVEVSERGLISVLKILHTFFRFLLSFSLTFSTNTHRKTHTQHNNTYNTSS